jgi:hypothetical protein
VTQVVTHEGYLSEHEGYIGGQLYQSAIGKTEKRRMWTRSVESLTITTAVVVVTAVACCLLPFAAPVALASNLEPCQR